MSKDLTEALRQAMGKTAVEGRSTYAPKSLPQAADPAPIPARTGTSRSALPATDGQADFVEIDYALREHYDERPIRSSDGLWTWFIAPVKTIHLEGGGKMELKEPPQ